MEGGLSFGDGHPWPHVSASPRGSGHETAQAAECPSRLSPPLAFARPSLHEKKPENLYDRYKTAGSGLCPAAGGLPGMACPVPLSLLISVPLPLPLLILVPIPVPLSLLILVPVPLPLLILVPIPVPLSLLILVPVPLSLLILVPVPLPILISVPLPILISVRLLPPISIPLPRARGCLP